MVNKSFCRYEKKFIVSAAKAGSFVRKIEPFVLPDQFCVNGDEYSIANIYYDTEDNAVIKRSLSKPAYKEKLRLRAYGIPDMDSEVFVELKKKINGLVLKRRATLSLRDAYSYIGTGKRPCGLGYTDTQVLDEIDYFLYRNEVHPAVYVAYDRTAYYAKDDPSIRITIDRNIRTRRNNLKLETGDSGEQLLSRWVENENIGIKDPRLIEIKVRETFPLWLVRVLSSEEMRMRQFSKYGNEYLLDVNGNISEHKIVEKQKTTKGIIIK